MSEYQYYEFCSIDKTLSERDRREIGSWSRRTTPSSRKATFNYSYGSFPKDEEKVLLKYFDAFFYIANWGTKRLMFKLPKDVVDYKFIKQYKAEILDSYDNGLKIYQRSGYVIIDICFNNEDGFGWIEEEQLWLTELLPIRNDILNKDYRSLFIMWLHILELKHSYGELNLKSEIDQALIPNNLNNLNLGLENLINFFEVDIDWINAAAKFSSKKEQSIDFEDRITALSNAKKNEYLLRLINEEINLSIKLKNEISGEDSNKKKSNKISISQLLNSVGEAVENRSNQEAENEKREHIKRMKYIAKNESEIKRRIKQNILRCTGKSYDEALKDIIDLKDLYSHQNKVSNFKSYIKRLRLNYGNKPALVRRFDTNGLNK